MPWRMWVNDRDFPLFFFFIITIIFSLSLSLSLSVCVCLSYFLSYGADCNVTWIIDPNVRRVTDTAYNNGVLSSPMLITLGGFSLKKWICNQF